MNDPSLENIAKTKDELDVERHFLGNTIKLSDGTEGLVFSRGNKNEAGKFLYNCHLCGVPNLPGERCLQTHIAGRKHQNRLLRPVIDAQIFRAPFVPKTKIQMNIAPGEPVPPGFENEVKPMPEIQGFLNKYKEHALIGVEYCLELTTRDIREPSYICLLCDKRGDPRTIISHWTSYNHRLKYLERHFPSVVKELVPYRYNPEARNVMPRLIQTVVEAIEDHYGRLSPTVIENNEFKRNRNKIIQDILSEKHFDEKNGPNFVNVIDKKMIDNLIKGSKVIPINIDTSKKTENKPSSSSSDMTSSKHVKSDLRKSRDSLDSISSDSDTSLTNSALRSNKNKRKKSQSPAYRVISRVKRSPPFEEGPKPDKKTLPTPRELSMQASEITRERYKWEKYRCLVELAVKELEKTLREYEKSPEKHPLYPEEWKKFWNRRYKELQAEKKDPNKYDFKPEWIIFWTKRMRELHDEEVENKKLEIKKKLGFSENAEEKTDQLKEQYKIKTSTTQNKNDNKPLPVIDISDDDESLSSKRSKPYIKHEKHRTRSRSRSNSFSSLSDDYDRNREIPSRSHERERERERDRDRDSIYYKEREMRRLSRERYISSSAIPSQPSSSSSTDYYRHSHKRPYGYPVPPHVPHYSYRTMNPYEIPHYEPKHETKTTKQIVEKDTDDGPLTVVAVLRLLTALEDHLGSLGPKVVDLLAKALALEKVKGNSSDEMLLNEDNCVFFETVKEKLKGQLIADVLDNHKIKAVKKAIKNIAAIIHQVNNKTQQEKNDDDNKDKSKSEISSSAAATKKSKSIQNEISFDRQLISSKLAAALVIQEKTDISTEDMDKLIHVFILMVKETKEKGTIFEVKDILIELGIIPPVLDKIDFDQTESNVSEQNRNTEKEFSVDIFDPNDDEDEVQPQNSSGTLESLTDSDLQTLLQNFKHLSSEEQHHLIAHLKKLESTDPVRVEKLRRYVDLSDIKQNKDDSLSKESILKKNDGNDNNNKDSKTISMYSDDEEDLKLQKVIDSDDDDDYNFDEVVKAASNNIKDSKHSSNESQRAHSLSREPDAEISNMSKASSTTSTATANLNASLADTQNLIANLMGSLQKNSQQMYGQQQQQQQQQQQTTPTSNGNMIPTVVSSHTKNSPLSQQQNKLNRPFSGIHTNFQQHNLNTSSSMFYNQQGNIGGGGSGGNIGYNPNPNNMFDIMQQQQTNTQNSGFFGNSSNNPPPFDVKQFNPTQVQQMLTSFLVQQQQQQQHNQGQPQDQYGGFQHQHGQNQGNFY